MLLENIVFDFNEAMGYYGITGHISNEKFIVITSLTFFMLFIVLHSNWYMDFLQRVFYPEAISMLSVLVIFDMLIMKGAYTIILILFVVAGFFYILFTNEKYKKYKNILISILDKVF